LNLSENFIVKIENLEELPNLETLILSRNRIGSKGKTDWEQLKDLPVSALDVSNNQIDCEDPEEFISVLKQMRNLKVLYLNNNPICSKIKNYRKKLIADIPNLKYLGKSGNPQKNFKFC
jgi:dynein assembly factor 1